MSQSENEDGFAWDPDAWRGSRDDGAPAERSQGYRVELRGGPLSGGSARVRDTEVRLSVVQEGGRLHTRDETLNATAPATGARILGSYGFSHREEALVWFPALGLGTDGR